MIAKIKEMLLRHEGLRLFPYQDHLGYQTIGIGRCIEKIGITEDEAMYLLANDIKRVEDNLDKNFGAWRTFPEKARLVCIDMTFQMGITGFMGFKQTRQLMQDGLWLEASEEMLRSKWATQTPHRALYNSRQIALCHNGKDNGRPSK
jgi:lysozyme|tara:strand:- start:207 stop:647 length:441 start_codon:yes stop_codon:yes gene_type:complete